MADREDQHEERVRVHSASSSQRARGSSPECVFGENFKSALLITKILVDLGRQGLHVGHSSGYVRAMTTNDPRVALSALITALERHYDIAAQSDSDDDERLDVATDQLAQAFETYDDALFEKFGIATPFVVFDDEDEYDDLDDDFDDFDDLDDEDELEDEDDD